MQDDRLQRCYFEVGAVHDLLLISDLHLGSHLKPRMRGEEVHLASRIEESFPLFMEHYQRLGRWQLVINGDFIDFWNVVLPEKEGETSEGLAVRRLHAVLDAHPAVEDALARFLADGNGIVFVAGNHDAELIYPGVRAAMVQRLESAMGGDQEEVSVTQTGTVRLDELPPGRVRFVRWFLREEGGAWIEHGHKFDPSCATPAQLAPMREGALVQTVAEVATRSFANVMPEIDYDAPDKFTAMDYVRWAVARGWRFVIRVILLYLRTAGRILALWAGPGRVDQKGKQDHEERLGRVAANAGLQMSALMALEKMAPPPSATTVAGLFKVTAVDHVLAVMLPLAVATLGARLGWWPMWAGLAAAVGAAAYGVARLQKNRKPRNVARDMAEVAAGVADVTGVPLVLMGHSHHGAIEKLGGIIYANSGSWLDGSHLVVRRDQDAGRLTQVELRRWRNGGITRLEVVPVPVLGVREASEERPAAAGGDDAPAFVPH